MDAIDPKLIDSLSDGVALVAPSGAVVAANRAAHVLMGLRAGQGEVTAPRALATALRKALAGRLDLPASCKAPVGDEGGESAGRQFLLVDAGQGHLAVVARHPAPEAEQASLMRDVFALIDRELRIPLERLAGAAQALGALTLDAAEGNADSAARLGAVVSLLDLCDAPRLASQLHKIVKLVELYGTESIAGDDRFELSEVVFDTVDAARAELAARGIAVVDEGRGEDLGIVYGSRRWMRQALAECISALAERIRETGTLAVKCRHEGALTTLSIALVADAAPGAPGTAARVSGDPDRTGLGVGLSIATRALALHGGRCAARQTPAGLEIVAEIPTGGRNASDEAMGARIAQAYARDLAALLAHRAKSSSLKSTPTKPEGAPR